MSRRELSNHRHPWIKSSHARRLRVEQLEDRRMLAVLTVQNNLDDTLANLAGDGELSLREAIEIANNPGTVIDGFVSNDEADEIDFASHFFDTSNTIILAGEELEIHETLTINGPGRELLEIDANHSSRVINFEAPVGELTLRGLTATGGRAPIGGGIRFYTIGGFSGQITGLLTIEASSVSGNVSTFHGGGIYSRFSSISISSSVIGGNISRDEGGGVSASRGSVSLTNTTIDRNSSGANGGAISTDHASVTLTNSTISGNSSRHFGGGIYSGAGSVYLTNSTVTRNVAGSHGGGIQVGRSRSTTPKVMIENSIVAGNIDLGYAPDLHTAATIALSINHSLIGDPRVGLSSRQIEAINDGVGNLQNVDPLLGVLSHNGGPTKTHALLPGSPAIDSGHTTLTTDQRGETRPFDLPAAINGAGNTSDMGAVEMHTNADAPSLVVTTVSDAGDSFDGVTTLREAIQFANNGHSSGGDITFDPTVFTDEAANLIRLTEGELFVADTLSIDGTSVGGVTITGDALGNDILLAETYITNVAASLAVSAESLDDNARVINFVSSTGDLTLNGLTISGGRTTEQNSDTDDSTFSGGGIRFDSVGTLALNSSSVSGNASREDGGGFWSRGAVALSDSIISGNHSTMDSGGGLYAVRSVTLTDTMVRGNRARRAGGGIFTRSGAVTLVDSHVNENTTSNSGAAGGGITTIDGPITLTNSTVIGNTAIARGGGISTSTGPVLLIGSSVSGNTSETDRGGGIATSSADITLISSSVDDNTSGEGGGISTISGEVHISENSSVNRNSSLASGGGIRTESGTLTLVDSSVNDNIALGFGASGGGIRSGSAPISLTRSTVNGNRTVGPTGRGGGIWTLSGSVTLSHSSVSGNSTETAGGGIYTFRGGLSLTNSTISNNASRFNGSAIFALSSLSLIHSTVSGNRKLGTGLSGSAIHVLGQDIDERIEITLINSTISGNVGGGRGGGLQINNTSGPVLLINSTITGNTAGDEGGGILATGTTALPEIVLKNSIVASNTAGESGNDLMLDPTTVITSNHSLIGDTTSGLAIAQLESLDAGVGNLLNTDPLLGPLADNGGPAQTHLPLSGSPVIDMGDPSFAHPPFYDQRGFSFARVVGGRIDIGAVEAGAMSADFDLDRDVDGADFLAWQRGYGADSASQSGGDANVDGVVDANDLAIWTQTYADRPATLADFDLDGDFDGIDFLTWQRGHGSIGASHSDGDANLDGVVDASDLAAWRVTYGQAAPGASGQWSGVSEGVLAVVGAWALLDEAVDEDIATVGDAPTQEVGSLRRVNLSERPVVGSSRRAEYRAIDWPGEEAATDQPWLSDELLERVFG